MVQIDWNVDSVCRILKTFDEQGLFEHLEIHTIHCIIHETEMRQMRTFNNIEKLQVWEILENYPLPEIKSLNELHIALGALVSKDIMQLMAINFENLQRVCILNGHLEDYQPFIRYARNIKEIITKNLFENDRLEISDFVALDEERKKLDRARKVTIFIGEKYFLKWKWAEKLNLKLIELKRYELCDSEKVFDRQYRL